MKSHFPIDPERNKFATGRYPVENRTLFPTDPATQFNQHNRYGPPVLQHCENCGCIQYPSREVCRQCLSEDLHWRQVSSDLAVVVSCSQLMHSLEYRYRDRTPWHVLSVQLQAEGALGTVLVHASRAFATGAVVRLTTVVDEYGVSMFFAAKPDKDGQKEWRKLQQQKISIMNKRDRNKINE